MEAASTREEAAELYRDRLNHLLARTLTETRLVKIQYGHQFQLAFRQGGRPIRALLQSRFGPVALSIGQTIDFDDGKSFPGLITVAYKYTLGLQENDEPALRWEYVRTHPPSADPARPWCRHHLQGVVGMPFGAGFSFDDFHLPTGYITLEEIIRFCIVDLDVTPLSENWDAILNESYAEFKRSAGGGSRESRPRDEAAAREVGRFSPKPQRRKRTR